MAATLEPTGCIVITGAASGIGRAVVDAVVEHRPGVSLCLLDIDGDALGDVRAELLHPDLMIEIEATAIVGGAS